MDPSQAASQANSYSVVCLEGSRGNSFIQALFQTQFELSDFEGAEGELIYWEDISVDKVFGKVCKRPGE